MERTGVSVIAALTGLCLLVAIGYVEAGGRHELPSDFLEQKPSEDALLKEKRPILQQSIVDTVNSQRSTWKAGHNPRFDGFTVKDFKRLCGTFKGLPIAGVDGQEEERPPVVSRRASSKVKLPESFDAREEWPRCKSIGTILDQGHCGSCWAFGTVESLSDRFCIHGLENVTLSENDLLACCGFECGFGCDGGYPYRAWQYFQRTGVVSSSCDPYFDDIGCGHPGCSPVMPTPACVKSCMSTDDLWTESKHYGTSAYFISSDPEELQLELYTNGPFNVDFDVFEDFAHYTSGVYRYTTGEYMGGHAVKLIGWGTEDGLDYWLIVNSWNEDWGESGLFKIVRGTNDCGIESDATGGMPFVRGRESSSM